MGKQIMVRRPQANGNLNVLVPAEVLSQDGDTLRVKLVNSRHPVEVKASQTLPLSAVVPGQARANLKTLPPVPQKLYPTSRTALANKYLP